MKAKQIIIKGLISCLKKRGIGNLASFEVLTSNSIKCVTKVSGCSAILSLIESEQSISLCSSVPLLYLYDPNCIDKLANILQECLITWMCTECSYYKMRKEHEMH